MVGCGHTLRLPARRRLRIPESAERRHRASASGPFRLQPSCVRPRARCARTGRPQRDGFIELPGCGHVDRMRPRCGLSTKGSLVCQRQRKSWTSTARGVGCSFGRSSAELPVGCSCRSLSSTTFGTSGVSRWRNRRAAPEPTMSEGQGARSLGQPSRAMRRERSAGRPLRPGSRCVGSAFCLQP